MLKTRTTKTGCYIGYAVQAVINNLPPLLYAIYSELLGLAVWQISLLITINFSVQILVDVAGSVFIDKIGYRASVLTASASATVGLLLMGVLPQIISCKFLSLIIPTVVCGIGSGLLEVVVSPMVEAIPEKHGRGYMSILHSFYCWGFAAMIVLSTLYLEVIGKELWFYLPMLWSLLPLAGFIIFLFAPIYSLPAENAEKRISSLGSRKIFWLLLAVMLCAGAAEVAMSQWASMFAELGLGVGKAVGDLLGPLTFAVCMGLGRIFMGKVLTKMKIETCILLSFSLCACSYLLTALAPLPALSFVGCAICGLSVAPLWPGTYNLGTKHLPTGGTAMFALFALAGDIGCAVGPDFVGLISETCTNGSFPLALPGDENGLRTGILFASLFAIAAVGVTLFLKISSDRRNKSK